MLQMNPELALCDVCTKLNKGKPVHHPKPVNDGCPNKSKLEHLNDEKYQTINKLQKNMMELLEDNKDWKNVAHKLTLVIDRLKQEKKQ